MFDLEERPAKKRRMFVADLPTNDSTLKKEPSLPDEVDALPEIAADVKAERTPARDTKEPNGSPTGFDLELFASITGISDLPKADVQRLWRLSEQNMETAINMYLDDSWREEKPAKADVYDMLKASFNAELPDSDASEAPRKVAPADIPKNRYIGAFGVTGWTTRSGSGLIKFGETVAIERTKPTMAAKRPRGPGKKSLDNTIVRFTNSRDEEVGRLEGDFAQWISTLLDQKVCMFTGSVVFAPERLKVNDTVYLQLRCYLLREAFGDKAVLRPLDTNRKTVFFEAKESEEEKKLRVRQVALVKLFNEINILPSQSSEQTEKHKRQGLLRAAEMADKPDSSASVPQTTQAPKTEPDGTASSPPAEPEEGEELKQDQLDQLYKKAQTFDFDTPEAEPADTFVMSLRKYQKQALHWMMGKEKDEASNRQLSMHPLWEEYLWPEKDVDDNELPAIKDQPAFYVNPYSGELSLDFPVQDQNCLGGILADEMGLGKTIEMLSLIHTHKTSVSTATANPLPRLPTNSSAVERAPYTTLVVAPMSLIAQWQSEAAKASEEGTLKVLLYYGDQKVVNLQNLCCEGNGANAPNVIITSYGVVLSEFNQVAANGGFRGSHGGLFSLDYFRIILDEAHYIKNRQSKTAKACYELKGLHRWVLTGTPIVNRLEDLFSLVHFLKVEPWANFSFWRTFITVPFESGEWIRALDVIQTVLEPLVLRRTKDMRTPDGAALVPLPPRHINVVYLELSKAEREVYDWIFMRITRAFSYMDNGTLLKSYTTVLSQIMRLRQSCCHPMLVRDKAIVESEESAAAALDMASGLADDMDLQTLIARFSADGEEQDANKFGAHVLKQIQDEAGNECPICSEEPMIQQAVTGCWHAACRQCLLDFVEHQRQQGKIPKCFICREPINARDLFEVLRHDFSDEGAVVKLDQPRISLRRVACDDASTKTAGLLSHLRKLRTEDPAAKSVVFSQFTSFLDVIQPALERDRIPYLRFDGTMTQKARAIVLEEFAAGETGIVLLLSLRAGGVGLNLTAAKRVFMMDPWWSFAVEAQAIDRVHRMGQESEVVVTRFIIKGSIEEKMLKIQERKKFLASSLGMMSAEDKKLQRIEDIKELLS